MFAKIIKEEVHGPNAFPSGHFKIYEIRNKRGVIVKYLCADYAHSKFNDIIDFGNLNETMVFECDKDGVVIDWTDLWFGKGDHVTDNSAITDMGYFLYSV